MTVYQNDFSAWSAEFSAGDYDNTAFLAGGATDNDVSSLKVEDGQCTGRKVRLGLGLGFQCTGRKVTLALIESIHEN